MPDSVGVGREAEAQAAEYLIREGYTIVTRRYKTRCGELDIVAMDGDTLVFVEVKARRTNGYLPEESISQTKLDALRRAMVIYVFDMEIRPKDSRLDLIAIDRDGLRHHKDILAL